MKIGERVSLEDNIESRIDYHNQRISLEANIISNAAGLIRDILPDFITKYTKDLSVLDNTGNEYKIKHLTSDSKAVVKRLEGVDYLNFADRIVMVPESFNGDLLEYATLLVSNIPGYREYLIKTLSEFNAILANIVTNKDAKRSLKDHTKLFDEAQLYKSNIEKSIRLTFDHNKKGQSRQRLNRVLSRSSDVQALIYESDKLLAIRKSMNLKEINSVVNKSVDYLKMILEDINTNNSEYSSSIAKDISKGTYVCAKMVEFMSVLYHDLDVLLASIDNIVEVINK